MSIALIAGIAVLVLIVAMALMQRARGPRVTTVEHTRRATKADDVSDAAVIGAVAYSATDGGSSTHCDAGSADGGCDGGGGGD